MTNNPRLSMQDHELLEELGKVGAASRGGETQREHLMSSLEVSDD